MEGRHATWWNETSEKVYPTGWMKSVFFVGVSVLLIRCFDGGYFEDHIGKKRPIVCFNVSILGKYYSYMYCYVLPNKLTHIDRQE